jgi:hypothetical protein
METAHILNKYIMNNNMQNEKEEIILDKAPYVAFCSLKKLNISPFVKKDGRVAFRISGNVSEVLGELQTNPLVPILDYLQRLETIRSLIFSLKGNRGIESHK